MTDSDFDNSPFSPTEGQQSPPQPIPATPPTAPGQISVHTRPSNWPTVIGIIAIVLSSLAILGGLWGVMAWFIMGDQMDFFMGLSGQSGAHVPQQAMMDAMESWKVWSMLNSVGMTLAAVILLAAGIRLLQRSVGSAALFRIWAITKMALVVGQAVLSWNMQQAMFNAMGSQGGPAMPMMFGSAMQIITVLFSLVFGWALPVFVLIWFAREKIRAEVNSWNA